MILSLFLIKFKSDMKKLLFLLWINIFAIGFAQVKSPNEFIPTYGKQITLLSSSRRLFQSSYHPNSLCKTQKYGETSEHRNLNLYYISTPENLANLEEIRLQNLASIGMAPKTSTKIGDKLIVWLSFNVHGNEWARTESALSVAYRISKPRK